MKIFYHKLVPAGDLYVIDDTCIYKDFIHKNSAYKSACDQLHAGSAPAEALSKNREVIPFSTITKLMFDVVRHDLDITYTHVNEKGETEEQEASLLFLDKSAFKQAYQAIKLGVGERLVESTYQPNAMQAAWGGLITFALFSFFTLLLCRLAKKMETEVINVSEEGTFTRILFFIVDLIGQTGVFIIGGVLALSALAYGSSRIVKKSGFRVFQAEIFLPPSIINLTLKYLALVAVLFFTLRLLLN